MPGPHTGIRCQRIVGTHRMSSYPSGGGFVLWVRILGMLKCIGNTKTMTDSCHDILRLAIGVISPEYITCSHVAARLMSAGRGEDLDPSPSTYFAVDTFSSTNLPRALLRIQL